MAETARLLEVADPAWDGWIGRAPHDFHHLAGYHALAEEAGEGAARLLVFAQGDRFMAWPFLIRRMADGLSDVTSVYGYTGPAGLGLEDTAFRQAAWTAFRDAWAGERVVTVFTRCHPILGNHETCADLHGAETPTGGELLEFGRTVSIDLDLSRDDRRARYPQPLRQDVKRAERKGLEVALDADWRHFSDFISFYRETMRRNDASDRYLWSDDYLASLRRALGSRAHLAVASVEDEAAGALLFVIEGEIATAHLTGLNPRFSHLSPLKPLLDLTCDIARDLGARHLHLGAGRGGAEDGLFAFKSRFSPLRHSFKAGRFILDPEANARLLRARGGPAPADGLFFPAYRAPAAAEGDTDHVRETIPGQPAITGQSG